MVYLNGEMVEEETINPSKHKFIGMFRNPQTPISNGMWDVYICPCRQHLWTVEECFQHWQSGHMDIPQYININ